MTIQTPLHDHDLHAYVDNLLSEEEIEIVDAWLAENAEDAMRVHAYKLQNAKLRNKFSLQDEPEIPQEMLDIVLKGNEKTKSSWQMPWLKIAATLLFITFGAVGGWSLNSILAPDQQKQAATFVSNAMGAHRIFTAEVLHPVEVNADQEAHLVKWLSKRVGVEITIPDLNDQGFGLVGGRLLSDLSIPAAQFMYENEQGQRLTLFVRSAQAEDTAFKYVQNNDETAFYWIDNAFAYALVAPLQKAQMMPIAHQVYEALDPDN
ncbi:anti-sigma factor [Terasakiella sp. A23]|uniref:anti-sigma factor family protein n=1 Tax=Terasakiella sp. FCG-A23 TaxID=3080561 RepID=UPI0029556E35|nr:anti-sigma factor [Terasakiella sp. A23]MDV7340389.1 anti-sigma factor [Terasakiella sp. A23]